MRSIEAAGPKNLLHMLIDGTWLGTSPRVLSASVLHCGVTNASIPAVPPFLRVRLCRPCAKFR